MDDEEGVNRRAGSGRKTVVDRDSLWDAIQSNLSPRMDALPHFSLILSQAIGEWQRPLIGTARGSSYHSFNVKNTGFLY